MMTTPSKRKPFTPEMKANWWHKSGFYRFYMLREGTSVPAVWFSLLLLAAVFSLKHGSESWATYVAFLQHPVVLLVNLIALLAALLHTKTWFELAPKASIIIIKNQKMGPEPIIGAFWAITALATLVILTFTLLY